MSRRGVFGALAGGIAALAGAAPGICGRTLSFARIAPTRGAGLDPRLFAPWCWTDVGRSPHQPALTAGTIALFDDQGADLGPLTLPGIAPWRALPKAVTDRPEPAPAETPAHLAPFGADLHTPAPEALPSGFDAATCWGRPSADAVERDAPPTAPVDLPSVWPGHAGTITATASLPPFAQVEALIELFARSGDAAPAFAAALIGELVLTRMRLAATDPRALVSLRAELP